MRRGPLLALVAIGIGLIAAPAIFQMFTRAPKGAEMIDGFRPFMSEPVIHNFEGHLSRIGRAEAETGTRVRPLFGRRLGMTETEFEREFPMTTTLNEAWPEIADDMGGMLATMREDIDNFEAIEALPRFDLFPWFFVAPGVLVAAVAGLALNSVRAGRNGGELTAALWGLGAIGVGLIAAPLVFQMFIRAPLGGQMINDFRPLMTEGKVTSIQNYFLIIGGAEGELRNELKPFAAERIGIDEQTFTSEFPAISAFLGQWPRIAADMAPMVGVMSDNVGNFAAVDALPPFPLFPWFFVLPGAMVVGLAFIARPRPEPKPVAVEAGPLPKEG